MCCFFSVCSKRNALVVVTEFGVFGTVAMVFVIKETMNEKILINEPSDKCQTVFSITSVASNNAY